MRDENEKPVGLDRTAVAVTRRGEDRQVRRSGEMLAGGRRRATAQQDHGLDHRRWPKQLQPPQRVGLERNPTKGQATHLAEPREPHDVGRRG